MDSWGDVAVFREQKFGAYEWDVETLWPLLTEHLHAAQVAECVTTKDVPAHVETTVNTVALKKYAAKLGAVGQEMLACAHRKPNAPRVRYERIEPLLPQLQASYEAKKAEIQKLKADPHSAVKNFAVEYEKYLNIRIMHERKRAEEGVEIRKREFGP
jgi:hypothetical protein